MRKKTSFDVLARKHQLVIAYPNGIKRKWNDGRSASNPVDDAAYLAALINALVADGGRPNGHRLGGTLSAQDTISLWSARNRCGGVHARQKVDRINDGTSAEIIQYDQCRAPLFNVLIEGHGHAWPGAGPRLTRLQGPASEEIDATALTWWFFSGL